MTALPVSEPPGSPGSQPFLGCSIGFFEPNLDFATNPSLVNLAGKLVAAGAEVDVLIPDLGGFPDLPACLNKQPLPRNRLLGAEARLAEFGLHSAFRHWIGRLRPLGRDARAHRYDLLVGVDPAGLVIAYDYARSRRSPLVYLSYEMLFADELDTRHLVLKKWEVEASRNADLVVIQDPWRARLLADENGLEAVRFAYLPVSPASRPRAKRSRFLHSRLGIDETKKIVLHAGNFTEWTYADELVESLDRWPDGLALVVHTRAKPADDDPYVERVRRSASPNVFLSTDPMPPGEYENLVAAADIGLALYKSLPGSALCQKNLVNIGFSSGKFSYYMKYGLPTLSVGVDHYDELLREYPFGENIRTMGEIAEALGRMTTNYSRHSSAARRLFVEKLAFDAYWPELERRLLSILSP